MNVVTLYDSGSMAVNGRNVAILFRNLVPGDFSTREFYTVLRLADNERAPIEFSNTHLGTLVELVRNYPHRLLP